MVLSAKAGESHAMTLVIKRLRSQTEALEVPFQVLSHGGGAGHGVSLDLQRPDTWAGLVCVFCFCCGYSACVGFSALPKSLSKFQRSIPTKLLHDKLFIS